MSDFDESGLAQAEERSGHLVERGIRAARMMVALDRGRTVDVECRDCGDPIPPARVAAAPWTTRCVDCQGATERR